MRSLRRTVPDVAQSFSNAEIDFISRLKFLPMTADARITDFHASLTGMFEEPEYHFPIVAAQYQYRERYYGLAGAAMLEDLFFDAFSGYLRRSQPTYSLVRPPRGEKGYDYEFNGLKLSHKVSKAGPIEIAALWDATRLDVLEWTFDFPISFTSSGYSKKSLKAVHSQDESKLELRPANLNQELVEGTSIVLVKWMSNYKLQIVRMWESNSSDSLTSQLPFRDLWKEVAIETSRNVRANQLEIFVVRNARRSFFDEGDVFVVADECFRPGTYLFGQESLMNIPVAHNNRAILIPKVFVTALMHESLQRGLYVPSTTWFSIYAGLNPPDLYLAQKADYDQLFSAYTRQT